MGQKVNPYSLRIGCTCGWKCSWFVDKKKYSQLVLEGCRVRDYLETRMAKADVSEIIFESIYGKNVVAIHCAHPGVAIGKNGVEIEDATNELRSLIGKNVQLNVVEIPSQNLNAKIVGHYIAEQINARVPYKRVMKQTVFNVMKANAQGVKIVLSGRLGGAEMARKEKCIEGRVPLHTFRADIDYYCGVVHTVYGAIGIKVSIFKGEKFC